MSLGTASPRRTLVATGLAVGAVLFLVIVAVVIGRGDRGPDGPAAPGQQPTVDRASQRHTGEPPQPEAPGAPASRGGSQAASPPQPRGQHHADLDDRQLAAARERAEAWVSDHLTWRHDEPRRARVERLKAHMTDRLAGDYDGWHGTAEIAHRRDARWVSTATVEHSYAETTTPERVVVVVIASQRITTRDGERREQQSHTVEVVPRQGEWRVDGMVL